MSNTIYSKISSIYVATCQINRKKYVGHTDKDLETRRKQHISAAVSGSTSYFHSGIRKHGIENFTFEIIYQSLDGEDCLKRMENYFILKFESHVSTGKGYNLTLGGEGASGRICTEETKRKHSERMSGIPKSEEHKKKLSNAHKGKTPWNKGIPQTEEAKRKQSKTMTGRPSPMKGVPLSEEHKKNLSKNHADFSGENHPFYGKHHTEEARKTISAKLLGKPCSKEHKQNVSSGIKEWWKKRKLLESLQTKST